ncbi:hypothetical protein AURDEDRAFT_130127 [Auricularia subglabra TFB-10046 SS5]|uniref:Uncharacterized protein n=1 Tax=Auricularia subglabra (strain TFB-10046 / SS5) TaxID=717982 RepID=J0WU98_AURST|nr:hypothetical protein AURDEDRAFT_130127 [Auricularia subglabra TFB-10046 SS5]
MLLSQVLVTVALATTSVLAALPPVGVPVVLVNQETGMFFDDKDRIAPIGNPIIGFPFNNGGNQKWILASDNISGGSADYTFLGVLPAANISSSGALGAGLNVQPTPSIYTITELGNDNITPFYRCDLTKSQHCNSHSPHPRIAQGEFVVTAPDDRSGQLTFQTLNTTSRFQHWRIFATSAISG